MQPIRTVVDALSATWRFPAVFELRKATDDWADEKPALENTYDEQLKHGMDTDFDALHRFKRYFDIPDDK